MIEPGIIRRAEYIIDHSNVVNILLDGCQRDPRGRKTDPNNLRLFLLGGLINVMENGNFVIEAVHHTLTHDLPMPEQFRLGVRRRATDPDAADGEDPHIVEILTVHTLYNVTKMLSKYLSYGAESAVDITEDERNRRHTVIRAYCDALMDVFDLGFSSSAYAIDATGIWAWGRGSHRLKPKTDDLDDLAT